MRFAGILLFGIFYGMAVNAQGTDGNLLKIRQQLEQVTEARANASLELNIDFINMPMKQAEFHYRKGKPISYTSEDFIIIPKRGMDFSWSELFRHEFMTVDRGTEIIGSRALKVLNVIPIDRKADFAIMTLKLDTTAGHIIIAEITSKNDGSYSLLLDYEENVPFPNKITVEFALERIRIPLNFMGKDTEIDKEQLKGDGLKKGKILLTMQWHEIRF